LKSSGLGLVNMEKKFRYLNRLQEVVWMDGQVCRVRAEWRALNVLSGNPSH